MKQLFVPVVTLTTQDNTKLLQQLKSEFKRTINTKELLAQNPNLNHLVEPSFQGVNRFFVLGLEDKAPKNKQKKVLSSKCRNERLHCYD